MNNHSVYNNKFNSTLSVFNNSSNLNNSIYVAAEKNKGKSRSSLNALSFYKANTSVYVKKVDKSDKKENVKTIIRYLGWKGYTGSVSPNLFKNPSMTDLINIWNFIFKHIDPLIEVNKDNYGEVVLSFYKDIGYPYTISKSTLVAPTTGLQYNTHLSALAWLCQLLIFEVECFNEINEEKEININEINDNDINMDEFILHSYKSFINKDEKNLNDLMNAKLDNQIKQLDDNISKKKEEILEKKKKIDEIKTHIKENDDLIKRNKTLLEENSKIKELHIESLDEIVKLEKEIKTLKKTNEEERKKNEGISEEIKKIKEVLEKQTLNKTQFLQMNEDIDKNKEKIESVKEQTNTLKEEIPNINEKLLMKHEDLEKLSKNINEKINEINEHINVHKNISISEWNKINHFSINIDSFDINHMLNVNWKEKKEEIKTYIKQDEEQLNNSIHLIEEEEHEVKQLEEEIQYLKEEIEKIDEEINKLNDETNHFINTSTDTYNEIVLHNQKILDEANEKYNEKNEMFKEVISQKEEKKNKLNEIKIENEKIFKDKIIYLQEACTNLIDLKNYSKKFISIVLEEKKNTLEKYKQLHSKVVE